MLSIRNMIVAAAAGLMLVSTTPAMQAQFAGTGPRDNFRDTTVLRPPAGSKVAIIVFEDLGCPACARAHPIERQVAEQYHVPLLRYDFPLAQHIWTFQAAVDARYLQDKVSPKLADEYRSAVFLAQTSISSKDDLQQFTEHWLQQHGQKVPSAVDPGGALAAKVQADYDLGKRLNAEWTPTLVVVTRDNYQVVSGTAEGPNDPTKLAAVVEGALAQTKSAPAAHAVAHR
ncbi:MULTISPECIES: thioredoxin domain-containing protein [Acidobacteriaceae]|uniref:DsbA family protein n=1 Tax=Acidobacteriaceae TaxID=204434 RepID=UPI0020B117EE|nr:MULTISPECIES: thioredoxin domain-containing protein [Acidobacteriaceae]MDW5267282.1 thioredoxin domain-containing protein [Edaphobacter sp.]